MAKTKKFHCKDCVMFEYDGFPYCLEQDLYTEVKADDEICDNFITRNNKK